MVRLPPAVRPLYPYLKPMYTNATGLVAPLTTAMSRRRGGALPTGVVDTLAQAARETGGRFAVARAGQTLHRSPPSGVPPRHPAYTADVVEQLPPAEVGELPGGRVLGPHHALIDGRDRLVQQLSFYFGTDRPRQHPLFLRPGVPGPLEVDGRLGVLATRGDLNYYHFLMDVLPRIAVLDMVPEIEAPPQWYVPADQGFQRELLELVGIGREQRIDATAYPHVRADVLVVPTPPSMTVINPPWVVAWLRSRLLDTPIPRKPGTGIYVSRGASANNRGVTNEAQVLAVLEQRGFSAVDPGNMTVAEQIRAFAQASCIVSPHGAALGNLVFASAGASVVELFPAGAALPDYWKLAAGVPGLCYRYLCGTGPVRGTRRPQLLVQDITVDLDALARMVDQALAE